MVLPGFKQKLNESHIAKHVWVTLEKKTRVDDPDLDLNIVDKTCQLTIANYSELQFMEKALIVV